MFIGIALNSVAPGGSGWTPAQLGSSLLGWWDAEDASTITQSGGLVSSWRDKVAGYDAVQATGASKPTYSATSYNSRAGLTFDGVDDELTLPSAPFPTGASACEIWALVDQTALAADTAGRRAFAYGAAGIQSRAVERTVAVGTNRGQLLVGDGAAQQFSTNSSVDFSGRHVVRARVGATEAQADVDGAAGPATTVAPSTATTRSRLGASSATTPSNFWQGVIPFVAVTGTLSSDQAAQFLAYLKARGGIA